MGVAGVGKTTVGEMLAAELGWLFYDADELHPAANVEKMRHGTPLTDADRAPWLAAIRALIHELRRAGRSAVIACSALKQAYRDYLTEQSPEVRVVYLKGDFDLIHRRLVRRAGHFMNPDLLQSQFATLEEPEGVLRVDASRPPAEIVGEIEEGLGIRD